MGIKYKNLDRTRLPGLGQPHHFTTVRDFTASVNFLIWAAPVACRFNELKIYTTTSSTHSSENYLHYTLFRAQDSAVMAAERSTSASGGGNDFHANTAVSITPTGNFDLTQGSLLELRFSATCQVNLSGVLLEMLYTPNIHVR